MFFRHELHGFHHLSLFNPCVPYNPYLKSYHYVNTYALFTQLFHNL